MSWWEAFKKTVKKNLQDQPDTEVRGLSYWRDRLFTNIIIYILPVSLIALVPGVIMSIKGGIPLLALFDILAVASCGVIAFHTRLSISARKYLLLSCLYLLSMILLAYLGSFGPGLLYLLALTVFFSLIFPIKISRWSIVINLIICFLFAFIIHFELLNFPIIQIYTLGSWIAVSSNLVFLSVVIVVSVDLLFDGLQKTIEKEAHLKMQLSLESKKLEKMLEAMEIKNQELEQFAFIASHDLQEPLRTISSIIELYETQYGENLEEDARTYLDFLSQSSVRMRALITGLLDYSRIGKERRLENVNCNDVLNEVLIDLGASISSSNASISVETLPTLRAYFIELKQLFQNLFSNALKFRKADVQPVISIKAQEKKDHYLFSIMDNGIGIDEKFNKKIFIIFQRLHPKSKYEGTGIGLAQCKKIVELHGGKIWVDSRPGVGSTFYFTILKNNTE